MLKLKTLTFNNIFLNRHFIACCVSQLRHALDHQKSLFENINIDWNLSHDEGSTDFSDDETVIEDRVSENVY